MKNLTKKMLFGLALSLCLIGATSVTNALFYPGDWVSSTGTTSQDGEVTSLDDSQAGQGRIIVKCETQSGCCWEIGGGGVTIYPFAGAPAKGEYPGTGTNTTLTW